MLVFLTFPRFFRHHHRNHPLPYQCLSSSGSVLILACCWVCPEGFRPICHTFRPAPVDSVGSSAVFSRELSIPVFALFFFSVWNSGPEIKFLHINFPISLFTVLSVPLIAVCIFFWNYPSKDFLFWFFSTNLKGYLTEHFFFGGFEPSHSCFSSAFVLAITICVVTPPSALWPHNYPFWCWNKEFWPIRKNVLPSFMMFVCPVLGFLLWCNAKGVLFDPVCTGNLITRNARLTLSARFFLSSIFPITKYFNVWIARSTVPLPVCFRGVQNSISMFRLLQISRYFFEINVPPFSNLILSGIPYRSKLLDKKFVTSFAPTFCKFLRLANCWICPRQLVFVRLRGYICCVFFP